MMVIALVSPGAARRPLKCGDVNAGWIPDHVIGRMNFGVHQRDPMSIGLAIDTHAVFIAVRFDESDLKAVRTDRHQRLDSHAHRVLLCELVRIMHSVLVVGTQETLRRPASVTLHELQERILAAKSAMALLASWMNSAIVACSIASMVIVVVFGVSG